MMLIAYAHVAPMPAWLDVGLKVAAVVALAVSALQVGVLKNSRDANADLRAENADIRRRLGDLEEQVADSAIKRAKLETENAVLRSALGAEKTISDMEARLEQSAAARHQQHEAAAEARTQLLAGILEQIRDQGAA